MKPAWVLLSFAICSLSAAAQSKTDSGFTTIDKKARSYIANITTIDNRKSRGLLLHAAPDSIWILPSGEAPVAVTLSNYRSLKSAVGIPASQVMMVKVKRKNAALRGGLYGLGAGAALGFVLGLVEDGGSAEPGGGYSMSNQEAALGGAIILGALGGGIGSLIGAGSYKVYRIEGDQKAYIGFIPALRIKALLR